MTKLYGVIGSPIAHSLSPLIHKGWMRDHGLDADYLALEVDAGTLTDGLGTLARRGAQGLNVTLPHKEAVLAYCSTLTPRAKAIGAVNTLWRPGDGTWHGDNTDDPGFLASLQPVFGSDLSGRRALVLGAGGAARAIVHALHFQGVSVLLANRTVSRAEALIGSYCAVENALGHEAVSLENGWKLAEQADFVVNTTTLGHQGGRLALPPGRGRLFYDISYGAAALNILDDARAEGWETLDGLSMLVHQAAASFERWFKIGPDAERALERVSRVVEATL